MKLSKNSRIDMIVSPEEWKCFDDCPVCRLLKRAAEKGMEINSKELEEAFSEAEKETGAV